MSKLAKIPRIMANVTICMNYVAPPQLLILRCRLVVSLFIESYSEFGSGHSRYGLIFLVSNKYLYFRDESPGFN